MGKEKKQLNFKLEENVMRPKKNSLESFPLEDFWFPVDWMTFFSSGVVFFVNFDGLVSFCCDESTFGVIEHTGEYSRLAVQRSGLHGCMDPLEVVACPPVPHVDGPVIGSRHQDSVRVNRQSVDDGVVARQVLDEVAVWEHPLLDVVGRSRSKRVLSGVQHQRSDGLLVVGQGRSGFPSDQIPQSDG